MVINRLQLQRKYDSFISLYEELKENVRKADKNLYERWKAGGFLVDNDIMSMYPTLGEAVERLTDEEDEDDDE